MKPQWNQITLAFLAPALLALCGTAFARCPASELQAVQAALNEAKILFARTPYDSESDLQKWGERLMDEAADLALEKERLALSERGNLDEERPAIPPSLNQRALNQLAYYRKSLEALQEKLQDPDTVARYREIIAPVLASLSRLRDVLPVLEKYDAELREKQFPRTSRDWAKQIDQAEENLLYPTDIKPTLMLIEHGIMAEMEAAIRLWGRRRDGRRVCCLITLRELCLLRWDWSSIERHKVGG